VSRGRLAPVAPLDPTALTNQIHNITASGYTPIGNALKAAADALPHEGPRSIVLVSDGEDTCAPPTPCDVARDLHQQGIDLTVHTVGFKVDATARDQLTCIAQETGGTYSDEPSPWKVGQSIPDHLRAGIYENPDYPCPSGCSVDIDNVPAMTLYRSLGFVEAP